MSKKIIYSINYCTPHPYSTIRYKWSDMKLYIYSDVSYLSVQEVKIRSDLFFYLGQELDNLKNKWHSRTKQNLTHVVQYNEIFYFAINGERNRGPIYKLINWLLPRNILTEMRHPQTGTPVAIDISESFLFMNITSNQWRSRSIDMRFYFVRYRIKQDCFCIFW